MFQPEDFISLTNIHIKCTLCHKINIYNVLNKIQFPLGGVEWAWNPHVCVPTHTGIKLYICYTNNNLPAYVLALFKRSVHACMSAKARIPKQLIGWSWDSRNSQQVLFTSCSCKRPAAGSSTCEKQQVVNIPIQFWSYTRVFSILIKKTK